MKQLDLLLKGAFRFVLVPGGGHPGFKLHLAQGHHTIPKSVAGNLAGETDMKRIGKTDMRKIPSIPDALTMASIAITIGVAPVAASAAGLDDSANLVCAANKVVACTKAAVCFEGDASTFDLVEFMFVDFKAKVVKARTHGDTRREESPIRILEKSNTQLILQGMENGHGWGMSIGLDDGRMSAAIAGESANFMIFGACTAL